VTPIEELLLGLLLGLSLVVPPGPMNAWIAAGAARSVRTGVLTGLGAMAADALLGAVVYGLDRSVDLHEVVRYVYVVGAGFLVYLAWRLARSRPSDADRPREGIVFAKAFALGISNPFQIVWWLTVGVGFAYLGGLVLLLGLFAAIAVWIVVFPSAVHAGTTRRAGLDRAVVLASAAILLGFAVYFVALFVLG